MSFVATSLRMLSGPIVWALHFTAIYGFTGFACARGLARPVPWVIALATLAAGGACLLLIGRERGRKQGFPSWMTAGLGGFALLAIVWEAVPVLMVKPCA